VPGEFDRLFPAKPQIASASLDHRVAGSSLDDFPPNYEDDEEEYERDDEHDDVAGHDGGGDDFAGWV
jgi:hypothetical protein